MIGRKKYLVGNRGPPVNRAVIGLGAWRFLYLVSRTPGASSECFIIGSGMLSDSVALGFWDHYMDSLLLCVAIDHYQKKIVLYKQLGLYPAFLQSIKPP